MNSTRALRWALLVTCVALVLAVRPSLPLDGDEGRNLAYNLTTSLAGLVGLLVVGGLWRSSSAASRVALGLSVIPLAAGAIVSTYFLFRGP